MFFDAWFLGSGKGPTLFRTVERGIWGIIDEVTFVGKVATPVPTDLLIPNAGFTPPECGASVSR